jgi:hypothetical protein
MADLRAAPLIMWLAVDGGRVHPLHNCDAGHKEIKLVTRILTKRIIAEEYYLLRFPIQIHAWYGEEESSFTASGGTAEMGALRGNFIKISSPAPSITTIRYNQDQP